MGLHIEEYALGDKEIGVGSQSSVFPATNTITKADCVAKVTRFTDESRRNLFANEVSILKRLKYCKYIIRAERVIKRDSYGIIFLKRYPYDLLMLVEEDALTLPEKNHIFTCVCKAVKECHDNKVAHFDLKPENILVSADKRCVQLCDFGTARKLSKKSNMVSNFHIGTVPYISPEMYGGKSAKIDGTKADIWSLSMLYHVLYTSFWPLSGMDKPGQMTLSDKLDEDQIAIISMMAKERPEDRCSIEELCLQLCLPMDEPSELRLSKSVQPASTLRAMLTRKAKRRSFG